MVGRVICFGELLLRFTSPGHERLMQSPHFDVHYGGAEANVGVSLAGFGHDVHMVSALPGNPFGEAMRRALKARDVNTDAIEIGSGRMGLYFLETGAVRRPSRIVYDRAHSVFAETPASAYDWATLLDGAAWLHVSGITPAVGPEPAKAAREAVRAARATGVKVAFDGNYRQALWEAWGGDGPGVLHDILSQTDTAFINERDIALILGETFSARKGAIERAFAEFPALSMIACTTRAQASVETQTLTGEIYTRDGLWTSRDFGMSNVVDRIGAGDAFAAGVLHGLIKGDAPQRIVDFAAAASVIKHSIPGDWTLARVSEVEDTMAEDGLDVRR